MFIKLGKLASENKEWNIKVGRETEKALQITGTLKITRPTGRVREYKVNEWLPKSQCVTIGDYIKVADWFQQEKDLPYVRIVCTLTREELKEKTGIDLISITPQQRVELVGKGLAKLQG